MIDSLRYRPLLISFLLICACVTVFGAACGQGFVQWDDELNVTRNPYLHPVTLAHIAHFWTSATLGPGVSVYRPVVYTVYALLALASPGLNPHVFHAVSLLVHTLNALLVFALLRRLVKGDWAAGAGAALFALHPVQVEPVAWVTGLTDLLGAFFSLLALLCYVQYAETQKRRRFALSTLWFVMALLSKPSAVTLPLIALAVDCGLLHRPWNRSVRPLSFWLLIAAVAVLITRHAEHVTLSGVVTPWGTRPLIAGDALAFYLGKTFWPGRLGIDYGRSPSFVLAHGWVYATACVPLLLALLLWRLRRPWLTASAVIFAASLLPTLGLIPFRFQTYSTVADRYLYLAMLGPALALAWLLSRLPGRLPPRGLLAVSSACVLVFISYGFRSALQVPTWQNSFALFGHAVEVNPQSWVAQYDLGALYAAQGQQGEARSHFLEALRLKPDYAAQGAYQLGVELLRQGKKSDAIAQFQSALQYEPEYAPAQNQLRRLQAK